ncbi:TonB-dependent siderophore receptor [Algihabitans albus]|uniref:TonB-dependent siderophore receptor n=1 Tax=Algihabitans albus TaxID=2164067 RepID=UPI0013C2DDAF|nr:TonB-dependent receptor [Algihabitans albus]
MPAQPLGQSLVELAEQTGVTIITEDALVAGRTAPPLSGVMAPEEAVRRLLSGSGLSLRIGTGGTVIVSRAEPEAGTDGPLQLQPITVDAVLGGTLTESYAAPDSFSATRTNTPIIETPQSSQAVTRQALEDAGTTEVADAYDYLAGIQRDNNIGGLVGDAYLARGFVADDILINGNRSGRPSTLDTVNVERIEALRGPTATLFGRADPGGLINIVTKQPLSEPLYQAEVSGGTGVAGEGSRFRDIRATLDSGGPIDEQGRARYRFNAAAEQERSFRQDSDKTVFFASPVVDLEFDDKTVANLELSYQYRQDVFDRGNFFVDGDLDLPRDFFLGEDQDDDQTSHIVTGALRVDRELSNAVNARLGLYGSYGDLSSEGLEPSSVIGSQVSAARVSNDGSDLFLTAQPELVAELSTGSIGHTLLFGLDASYRESDLLFFRGAPGAPIDAFAPDFPVDLPDFDLSVPGNQRFDSSFTARSIGVYAQNQIDLSEQWKLLLGARWDSVWLSSDIETTFNAGALVTDARDEDFKDSAFLPRAGLVYQPVKQVGLYASYSESYRAPPPTSTLRDANGDQVDAETGRSFEVGVKLDALEGRLTGTLAVFRTEKENVIDTDPADPFAVTNLGEVRSQGVEFDLSGEVFDNFSLGVTYAFTDAEITDNEGGVPSGTRLRNVPRHAASLQAAYRFTQGPLDGLRIFGGAVYQGEKPTSTEGGSPPDLPDYVRLDLGASYEFNENLQARLQLQNLTDTEYYTSANGQDRVTVGQPFNATLGVRVTF